MEKEDLKIDISEIIVKNEPPADKNENSENEGQFQIPFYMNDGDDDDGQFPDLQSDRDPLSINVSPFKKIKVEEEEVKLNEDDNKVKIEVKIEEVYDIVIGENVKEEYEESSEFLKIQINKNEKEENNFETDNEPEPNKNPQNKLNAKMSELDKTFLGPRNLAGVILSRKLNIKSCLRNGNRKNNISKLIIKKYKKKTEKPEKTLSRKKCYIDYIKEIDEIRANVKSIKKEEFCDDDIDDDDDDIVVSPEEKFEFLRSFYPESIINKLDQVKPHQAQNYPGAFLYKQRVRAKDPTSVRCPVCGFLFYKPEIFGGAGNGLQRHLKLRHPNYNFEESEKFLKYSILKELIKSQNVDVSTGFVCRLCKSKFLTQDEFKNHTIICENPLCCDICEKRFRNLKNLKDHHTLDHPGPGRHEFFCAKCGASFINKKMLDNHVEEMGHV